MSEGQNSKTYDLVDRTLFSDFDLVFLLLESAMLYTLCLSGQGFRHQFRDIHHLHFSFFFFPESRCSDL